MPGYATASVMNSLLNIPIDLDAFLLWFKDRTETAWASFRTKSLEEFEANGLAGGSWRTGTKWQRGLEAHEIDALELRWNILFPEDYRRFLSILNAPDRGLYSVGWRKRPTYDLYEIEDRPSFFDWRRDEKALANAFEWPLDGIMFDVENASLWPDSWGERPQGPEIRETVSRLVAAAPRLVPIAGHRYLLADTPRAGNPVLSVWQSDITIHGSNLRKFLLMDISDLLGLDLDHDEAENLRVAGITGESIAAIPFWGELMLGDY